MRAKYSLNKGLDDTQRITLPPPSEKQFMPPKPPKVPKKAKTHPPSRLIPWVSVLLLLGSIAGFFNYVLKYVQGDHQRGDSAATASQSAWIPAAENHIRVSGQLPPAQRWPTVRVSAIMAPSSSLPGAVTLDGKLYGVSDEFRGIRVAEIGAHTVLLEYNGEQRRLHPGQTTNP